MSNANKPKGLQYILDYIDSFLDTTAKKVFFLLATLVVEMIVAYLIAIFDVGLVNWDISLKGMLAEYREPGASYPWDVLLVLTLCVLFTDVLIIWKNGAAPGGRNFSLSKSNVYGSGREISKRELNQVADITAKDSTKQTILGQLDDTGNQVIASKPGAMPNDNILVFGPPGCGKSTSFVRPFIAQAIMRRHSLVVSDTKGEVYATTAEYARYMGYRVLRLDLKDPAHSDGWAVLKELRHDDVRALIFAQTVMANTGNPKDNFAAPQESLLKACCLFQERMPDLPDSQRTFYNAFAMLLQGAEALDATITGAFAAHGPVMQVVSDSYSTFLQGSPNLRGNIITGLANRLQVLASPPVREMTSADEIDFASLGKEPTILYISMSDQHQTMSFLASLAFSFAFLDLVDLADSNPKQRLDVPVDFLMEEFGNLGHIPNIGKYLSTARSRGISINLVIQSLAQLTSVYEESMTDIILADCAKWLCLGCNDRATAELLEWRSGEATVKVKTEQHDALEPAFKLTHKNSTGDGRRNFYTANDIMKLKARKEAFIIWQQMDALKAEAFPIFQHNDFIKGNMPEISAITLIPLANKEAKRLFRKWEEERIASFNTWMANGGDPLADFNGLKSKTATVYLERPGIIPLHTLERMALAEADGKVYNPANDPDTQQKKEKTQKVMPTKIQIRIPRLKKKIKQEDEVWDLSEVAFQKVETPQPPVPKAVPVTAPDEDIPTEMEELVLTQETEDNPKQPEVAPKVSEPVKESEPAQPAVPATPAVAETAPQKNEPKPTANHRPSYAESKATQDLGAFLECNDINTRTAKKSERKKTAMEASHSSLPD